MQVVRDTLWEAPIKHPSLKLKKKCYKSLHNIVLFSIAFSAACSVAKQRVATLLTCHAHGQYHNRRNWVLIEKTYETTKQPRDIERYRDIAQQKHELQFHVYVEEWHIISLSYLRLAQLFAVCWCSWYCMLRANINSLRIWDGLSGLFHQRNQPELAITRGFSWGSPTCPCPEEHQSL